MTVFVVFYGCWSEDSLYGEEYHPTIAAVFGSRQQAEEFVEKHPNPEGSIGAYEEIVEVTYTPAPPLPHPAPKFDIGG